jgi:malonate-semialdehyde dehydrogenase (acetylating)/methylmalonate-semialdehyde dehydrogenase
MTATPTETALLHHWIAGRPCTSPSARSADVTESATGEVIARVPVASSDVVCRAVDAASAAGEAWGRTSISQRTKVLFAFRELVDSNREQLARIITREHGKVLSDALGEVQRGREVVEFACGVGEILKGSMSGQVSRGVDAYSLRQPLGVVAGITPFNFPVMVQMWMHPVAIATGNAFVLKPSEQVPSAPLLIAELWARAGLPDGVFNVVNGDKEAVEAILAHPAVAAVSFVGSTPVARRVYETGTRHAKRVQALGGAKNHAIVLPDADLDLAADGLISAGYGSAGQRCMAVSVAVAVGAIAEPLIAKLCERIAALKVGDGTDPESDIGPLVSEPHRERVAGYVDSGVVDGAELLVDGRDLVVPDREGGYFLGPCLFDRVKPGMRIYDDEIFGPVLVIVRAESYAEAIDLINTSRYGNGAAIFTNDGGAARAFEQEAAAGMVGINVPIPVPMAYHSFGGWNESLFGDLHIHGPEGVNFYTRGKMITRRWTDPAHRGVDLGFPVSG